MLSLLISVIIAGLIFYLVWWFIGYIGLPAPFDKVARVIVGLVALIYLIDLLSGLNGHPLFLR